MGMAVDVAVVAVVVGKHPQMLYYNITLAKAIKALWLTDHHRRSGGQKR
jgi:hypothetical protein